MTKRARNITLFICISIGIGIGLINALYSDGQSSGLGMYELLYTVSLIVTLCALGLLIVKQNRLAIIASVAVIFLAGLHVQQKATIQNGYNSGMNATIANLLNASDELRTSTSMNRYRNASEQLAKFSGGLYSMNALAHSPFENLSSLALGMDYAADVLNHPDEYTKKQVDEVVSFVETSAYFFSKSGPVNWCRHQSKLRMILRAILVKEPDFIKQNIR